MIYKIELSLEAEADLDKICFSDKRLFNRILKKIETLAERPKEGKPLTGNHSGEYALRVGNFGIVYEVYSHKSKVFILTVKHRKNVYKS